VRVAAERADSTIALVMWNEGGDTVVLRRNLVRVGFRYLLTADEGGTWVGRWKRTLMLPFAIGLIAGNDTIVARIGERR
jgi:hypothetical protein